MNTIEKIQAVQNTMEDVAVAGHENWNRMLACWQTLQEVKKEMMEREANETALRERDTENTAGTV
jgi:hypothetical protein